MTYDSRKIDALISCLLACVPPILVPFVRLLCRLVSRRMYAGQCCAFR